MLREAADDITAFVSFPVGHWKKIRGRPRQERLALLYNEQGLRPAEIAGKLGVSTYTATQIVLTARNHPQH